MSQAGARTSLLAGAMLACISLSSTPCAQPADVPPVPAARNQAVPPPPAGDRYVWQSGSWEWEAAEQRYAWHPGRYVARRPANARFAVGRWAQSGGQWAWVRARWR